MKDLLSFLLGIVLTIVGAMLFLSKVRVSNYNFFYRYNNVNVTAILLLLMCIFFIANIVYPNFLTKLILGLLFLAFVVTIIMSLNFYIMYMSALEIFLILATFCGGLGLTLKGALMTGTAAGEGEEKRKRKHERKQR